jgi:hypothetical protein
MWAQAFDHVESSHALEARSQRHRQRRPDWYIGKKIRDYRDDRHTEGGLVSLL